jgi:hypothetical protein
MNEAAVLKKQPTLKDDRGGNTFRVLRGASWNISVSELLLSSCRISAAPTRRDGALASVVSSQLVRLRPR